MEKKVSYIRKIHFLYIAAFKITWNLIHPCSYFVVSSLPQRSLLSRKKVNVSKTRRGCRHANLVSTMGLKQRDRHTHTPPSPYPLPPSPYHYPLKNPIHASVLITWCVKYSFRIIFGYQTCTSEFGGSGLLEYLTDFRNQSQGTFWWSPDEMIMDAKYQLSNTTAENITSPTKTTDGNNFNSEIAVLLLIAVGIVIINGVVLYLFIKEKTLRTTSNYPLFSLALCDFLCGIVVIPLFTILSFTSLLKSLVEIKFYLGFLQTVLDNFVAIATVYHLVVITAERYMAIRYPLKHLVIRKKRIQKVLVIVWSCSLLISFLPFKWISAIFPVYQPVSTYYLLGFTAFCLCLPSLYHTASCFSHLCIYSKPLIQHLQKGIHKRPSRDEDTVNIWKQSPVSGGACYCLPSWLLYFLWVGDLGSYYPYYINCKSVPWDLIQQLKWLFLSGTPIQWLIHYFTPSLKEIYFDLLSYFSQSIARIGEYLPLSQPYLWDEQPWKAIPITTQ